MKPKKQVPRFRTEEEERAFWSKHESTEYVDYDRGKRVVFPNLKASTQTISLRVPEPLLDAIKAVANERDVPYQSLMKMILAEWAARELR